MAGLNLDEVGFTAFFLFQIILAIISSIPVVIFTIFERLFFRKEKNITGQTVLITGSARGLGKGLAKQFAKCGCKLICVDVNKSLNEETVQEINEMTGEPNSAESLVCDVGDWEDVKRLREEVYKRHDKIDILVNNAGIVYGKTILNESEDVIKKIINVNLASNYWMVQAFLPRMEERNEGHLVFINSVSSLIPLSDAPAYTASKYGLQGFTESLLDGFGRDPNSNIKISSVHPVFIKTEGLLSTDILPKRFIIEVDEAAQLIVRGIRKEYIKFIVPGNEFGFRLFALSRILPTVVYQRLINSLYSKIKP